ncbi:MAG: hypothetical protein P1U58_14400 [Verrucomicrobiales bacterium]|nr:hypothetical protein [Verrucomicrobiales bacterium]
MKNWNTEAHYARSIAETLEKLAIRQHSLLCSLEKIQFQNRTVVGKDSQPLIGDLKASLSDLYTFCPDMTSPALSTLLSPAAREWELDLVNTIGGNHGRWESVLRIMNELSEIVSLIDQLESSDYDQDCIDILDGHRAQIAAHRHLFEGVVSNLVNAELAKGRPIKRVIEAAKEQDALLWDKVCSELLGTPLYTSPKMAIHSLCQNLGKVLKSRLTLILAASQARNSRRSFLKRQRV